MSFHLDYEGFSRADLKKVGAARYASDPSTQVLMASISTDTVGPYLWVHPQWRHVLPSDPRADQLMDVMARSSETIWAHNALFEHFVTRYRWALDVKLPPIALNRWRCTSVLARCAGMPGDLETLARTLGLSQQKDTAGRKLIELFCIPQEDGSRVLPSAQPEKFRQFGEYCLQDNRAERAVHVKLQPFELRGAMLDAWLFDIRMNDRGFPVNVKALRHAQKLINQATAGSAVLFRKLTGLNPTQRAKVKAWLEARGCEMMDMTADTVDETLDKLLPAHPAYKVLRLYSLVQYAAVKKVKVMLEVACADQWCRGQFVFHGASTGRWTARGVQPHNFKRPTMKGADGVYRMICAECTLEEIEMVYGGILEAISNCIRNFIHWPEGELMDADYNAVEARIVCWLAGQLDRLNDWAKGVDQYKMAAGHIYGVPADQIINPSERREVGKRTILGCGFQMGAKKYKSSLWDQYRIKVTAGLADKAVTIYRSLHRQVVKLWYACGRAAAEAIKNPGQVYKAGAHLKFWVARVNGIPFLFMRLPSGRKIAYPWPEMSPSKKYEGEMEITFFGNIEGNHWGRISTYGGKLVENATQGTAFDLMAHGSVTASHRGAEIVLLVHDQSLGLNTKTLTIEQYCAALTDLPPWAAGLPLKAEGKLAPYYRK